MEKDERTHSCDTGEHLGALGAGELSLDSQTAAPAPRPVRVSPEPSTSTFGHLDGSQQEARRARKGALEMKEVVQVRGRSITRKEAV